MSKEKVEYLSPIITFDIETTNYRDKLNEEDEGKKKTVVYTYAFTYQGKVHRFRTQEQAFKFLARLRERYNAYDGRYLVVWVHNLPFEFAFLKNTLLWEDIFAIADKHNVVRARTPGFEFRCTYALTNKGLKGVGKEVGIPKLNGDLDYDLMRHHETPLTEEEWGYVDNDVLILHKLIEQRLRKDSMRTIPMTKTGYVRRMTRINVRHNEEDAELIKSLTMTTEDYTLAKKCFSGGYTHANAQVSGDICYGVAPWDLASAYPAVIVREFFPMSKFVDIDPEDAADNLGKLAMMLDVTLEGVECNYNFAAISESKCDEITADALIDNGRVHSASRIRLVVNDVELQTIMRNYSYDEIYINSAKAASYGRLPKSIVETILGLYVKKTQLKGVKGMELEYNSAKEDNNSPYGMMSTDPVKTSFTHVGKGELVQDELDIEAAIVKENTARNRFLFYPWGGWVTAHTRALLLGTIMDMEDAGVQVIYADTDSNYYKWTPIVDGIIARINEELLERNTEAALDLDLDPALFAPLDPEGIAHPIGIFEHDNDGKNLDEFKTLGAKRYATVTYTNAPYKNQFSITVAGLNKEKGAAYVEKNGGMDFFKDGMFIPASDSGRLVHAYSDEEITNIMVDYLGNTAKVKQKGFVHLEAAPYTLSLGDEYKQYLNMITGLQM